MTDSGRFSDNLCRLTKPIGGIFNFSGSGVGTFIHGNTESGALSAHYCAWSGLDTISSVAHPRNSITMALSVTSHDYGTPCNLLPTKTHFTVSSGTGRFANATGGGSVVFTCDFRANTYTDKWSGTITF